MNSLYEFIKKHYLGVLFAFAVGIPPMLFPFGSNSYFINLAISLVIYQLIISFILYKTERELKKNLILVILCLIVFLLFFIVQML